jgi:hypothetical protein
MPDADKAPALQKDLTATEAAKRVKRAIVETVADGKDAEGNPITKQVMRYVPIAADEVLAYRDYRSHVVVVTKDGRKFSSADQQDA